MICSNRAGCLALTAVGCPSRNPAELRDATIQGLALQSAGRIHPEVLVTHRFGLDQVDAAFEALQGKPAGFLKSVVDIA